MSADDTFFDTNIVLYLFSQDDNRAERAEALLADGGLISVQVLNELTSCGFSFYFTFFVSLYFTYSLHKLVLIDSQTVHA
ncbi:MAG: hypothetical protein V2B19_05770 [Pseudomonadota bacterium]